MRRIIEQEVETRRPKKRRLLLKLFLLLFLLVAGYVGAAKMGFVYLSTPVDMALNLGFTDQHGELTKPRDNAAHMVVLLHGLGRTKWSMWKAERYIKRHGYEVWNESYDASKMTLDELARDFKERLDAHLGERGSPDRPLKLYAVAHSMGGLILRRYFQLEEEEGSDHPHRQWVRMVFLGTPNLGACRAQQCKDTWWFQWLFGTKASFDLVPNSMFLQSLPTKAPPGLGNIIGGCGDENGYSSDIPGDDDGRVGVSEAHMEGEKDSLLLHSSHTFLPTSSDVLYQALFFLGSGVFQKS